MSILMYLSFYFPLIYQLVYILRLFNSIYFLDYRQGFGAVGSKIFHQQSKIVRSTSSLKFCLSNQILEEPLQRVAVEVFLFLRDLWVSKTLIVLSRLSMCF